MMNKNLIKLFVLLFTLSLVIIQIDCSRKTERDTTGKKVAIQNSGSDTMVNLAQAWAEAYANIDSTVSVEVAGGGSGTGIAALINGTVNIANSSRKLKPEEFQRAKQNTGKEPYEIIVGYDALAVYVHRDNPLDEISLEQLAEIYGEGGAIEKWSQLGIKNSACSSDEIIRVSRQSNSGTYFYFREAVLGEQRDFKLGSRDLHGSKDVVELIGRTPCAIGYSGMGYATDQVKMLKISRKTEAPAYAPTKENELSGDYPISRPLHFYSLGKPTGNVKKYIQWILSDEGQKIVAETGYVPLTPEDRQKYIAGLAEVAE